MKPFFNAQYQLWIFYRLPVIAYCGLIYWQSSFPDVVPGFLFPHSDKVLHMAAYFVLAVLAVRSLKKTVRNGRL